MLMKLCILPVILLCFSYGLTSDVQEHPKFEEAIPVEQYLSGATNHSLILGKRRYGDKIIYADAARKSSRFLRTVETDIQFPNNKIPKNLCLINYLEIIDRKGHGIGGWPSIIKGGVGAKDVRIHFKSQRGHGLDYVVHIYGYSCY